MSSSRLQDAVLLTKQHPELSFGQVQQFICLASRLKDNILLTQPSSAVLALDPLHVLPPTISAFVKNSCNISAACVEACWDTLKMMIWHDAQRLEDSLIHDFAAHGHSTVDPPMPEIHTPIPPFYICKFIPLLGSTSTEYNTWRE